jgi:ribosomal protein S8
MPHPRQSNLAEEVYKVLIPEEYLVDFEVNHIENKHQEWIIELVEKADRKPPALAGKQVVLDGYNNEIDIFNACLFA